MREYYAHTREDGTAQTVQEHLIGTAELCRAFAMEFRAGDQGYLAGLVHDIGKYSEAFQRRLLQNGPRVDHSTAGAYECFLQNQPYAAFCVAGHHGGLPDGGSRTDNADQATFCGKMRRAQKQLIPDYSAWNNEMKLDSTQIPSFADSGNLAADFYVRMLFSCLTDADYLDTEQFMSDGCSKRDSGDSIPILTQMLDSSISKWFPPKNDLNRQRCAILSQCIRQGDEQSLRPGVFSLSVPTGGGKTVSSLAFALHHARTHNKKRVIYVIPYTSIIEQTADQFRDILGAENVLEHHAGVQFDVTDEANSASIQMMRSMENWDKPVIVTTAVQFFESIYANSSSKCRKLHNLANSVIVFDEAQMLPLAHLRPCVSAISQLVAHFGVSAVLCTATQPALDNLIHEFLPEGDIIEICPKDTYEPSVFQRVTIENWGTLSWEDIAERMRCAQQSLCIVNTRKSAKELFSLLDDCEGTYHLSTTMVPAHRRRSLNEIRKRLVNDLPCRVVSTSLIEAGVDVDFPMVLRELSGLDSVLQAAGRCNREGKRSPSESKVAIFTSTTSIPPLFRRNVEVGKLVLDRYSDPFSDEAISLYFKELFLLTGEKAQDQKQILPEIRSGSMKFATIAHNFRLIDSDTVTVYIPWEKGAELIERMKYGEYSRELFREAAQFSVSLFRNDLNRLIASGDVQPIAAKQELWYLANADQYHEADGISLHADTGNGLFV